MKNKLKILLAPSAYYPSLGGVEELTAKLAATYLAKNHEVIVATSRPQKSRRSEVIDGIKVYRFNFYTPAKKIYNLLRFVFFFPVELLKLYLLVKKYAPDIIHLICNGNNVYYFFWLKKLMKVKIIITTQGELKGDDEKIYQRSFFFPYALKKMLTKADYLTACSAESLQELLSYSKDKKIKKKVVFNGVDLKEFKKNTVLLKQQYIFSIGRLSENKGQDLLLRAFGQIAEKHPQINLYIGGAGGYLNELKKILKDSNFLKPRVKFLGRLNRKDCVKFYKSALFVVLPSRYEAFGIVALEAMAAGKAVLATKYGGTSEFVLPQVGRIFDPLNQKDFVTKLEWMLKNYQKLEKNSVAYVQKFDWVKIAEQYEKIYSEVLSLK